MQSDQNLRWLYFLDSLPAKDAKFLLKKDKLHYTDVRFTAAMKINRFYKEWPFESNELIKEHKHS